MTNMLITIPLALGVLAGLSTGQARADDAYICDGGRLVYARPETLEKLKQTDPCIAGYYNVKPVSAPADQPVVSEPKPSPAAPQRPARAAGTAPPVLKPSAVSAVREVLQSQPKVVEASAGTDFRNVPVINAPEARVFRHER